MASIVVLGAGIGGMPAAYELKKRLGKAHDVTLINGSSHFQFTPSNPWVMVGWRTPDQVQVAIEPNVTRKGIRFIASRVASIDAPNKRISTADGQQLAYDYLVITTGPKLAFEDVPGLGPDAHTHSVCTTPHATMAAAAYQRFLEDPGPIVVGAVQGASCFGPAYETALILDADLRKRKLRHKVPMHFVTSEPYIGHMGLGGVGDSKGLLESELRRRHIVWTTNAKLLEAHSDSVTIAEHDARGEVIATQTLPSRFSMFVPAFKGVDPVASVADLCNPRGFVLIDKHQRSPAHPSIYAAGVCVAIPPVEVTPVATGAPKTGYMIESMVAAIVDNIAAELAGTAPTARATWNAVCLADTGDGGFAFVALSQIPPRNVTWAGGGKWVHVAKIAFEKYFMRKMKTGNTDPVYEKYVLSALGIERLLQPEL